MNKTAMTRGIFYAVFFFITSCVTINIYFPAAAVEKAADKIVEEVWGEPVQKEQAPEQKKQSDPQSFRDSRRKPLLSLLGPREALAEEADINVTTPAIRALKDSIQARSDSIKPYMDRGNVGIGRDGLLVVRSSDGLNLKEKATITRLIEAENADRNALYAEIARANNFSPDRVSDIQNIFAGSWMKQARQGWWMQNEDGSWVQK